MRLESPEETQWVESVGESIGGELNYYYYYHYYLSYYVVLFCLAILAILEIWDELGSREVVRKFLSPTLLIVRLTHVRRNVFVGETCFLPVNTLVW